MKKEIRRATQKEIDEFLKMLEAFEPRNLCEKVAREHMLKYLGMTDFGIYHHFMDNPAVDESDEVPRLFKQGLNFITQNIPLKELPSREELIGDTEYVIWD